MGFAVVIAENGFGIPVISVEANAPAATIAENGLGIPIVLVEQNGTPMVISGLAGIELSAASFTEGAAQGTAIGTLSVFGGSGFYTFTLTDDAGGKVELDFQYLEVGATPSTAGSFSITVHADNGAGSVFDRTFLITAIAATGGPVAPILSLNSIVGADATFDFELDNTIVAGDQLRRQVQLAGGSWSALVDDTTHTITAPEDVADEVSSSILSLANGNYEIRGYVIVGGTSSVASNTVSFTISATSDRLLWGSDQLTWGTDLVLWN